MIYEYEAKTEKDAIEMAAADLGLEKDQFDVEIVETQKTSIFKKGYVKIRIHTVENGDSRSAEKPKTVPSAKRLFVDPMPQGEFETKIIDFTSAIISKMGYENTVDVMFREERKLGLRLSSASSSVLIGRKGKNLDALQLLVNVYAGKLQEDILIILDIENYRIRREEFLVRLAYTTADNVRTSRSSVLLEPMNPFERRLIHTTLNDIDDVETKSEGDGLYKQVRVIFRGFK